MNPQLFLEKLIQSIENDPALDMRAVEILTGRIEKAGKRGQRSSGGIISYSDLVKGVTFNLENGSTHTIDTHNWTDYDRHLIGNYLSRISVESYRRGGFLAQCLVFSKKEKIPSSKFFIWMRDLGVIADLNDKSTDLFLSQEMAKAYEWY